MRKLPAAAFARAKAYIQQHCAAIDQAWYRYHFESESTEDFLRVLADYQAENGGFGGLVHEFEYQGPCLKCTEHAFRYLYYLKEKPAADHPVIQNMMRYVLERYRPELGHWGELLAPGVNDGLHVWWWTYGEDSYPHCDSEDERIRAYDPNGQAALAAFVALYSELVPAELYQDIIRYPVEKVLRYYDQSSPWFDGSPVEPDGRPEYAVPYNIKCLQQFCDCLKDRALAGRLSAILCQHPTASMDLNLDAWNHAYLETACDVVSRPDSFLYPAAKAEVDRALDALIDQQSPDGAWRLPYRFGEEAGFRVLEAAFDAHITALYLAELQRFDRIESSAL